jgi:hypothetical protein
VTTIACDPRIGVMAGDTQLNGGRTKAFGPKVERLADGSLFGAAGDCKQIRNVIAWLNKGAKGRRPKMTEVDALVLGPQGCLWLINNGWPPILQDAMPAAVGSGDQAALAAMLYFHASPREAVKAAARVNPETGGRITTLKLKPPTAPK